MKLTGEVAAATSPVSFNSHFATEEDEQGFVRVKRRGSGFWSSTKPLLEASLMEEEAVARFYVRCAQTA